MTVSFAKFAALGLGALIAAGPVLPTIAATMTDSGMNRVHHMRVRHRIHHMVRRQPVPTGPAYGVYPASGPVVATGPVYPAPGGIDEHIYPRRYIDTYCPAHLTSTGRGTPDGFYYDATGRRQNCF